MKKDIITLDTKRQVLLLARQGFNQKEISTKLGISVQMVKDHLSEEMNFLSVEIQEFQEYWYYMTMARSEHLLSRGMAMLDRLTSALDLPPEIVDSLSAGQLDTKSINETIKTLVGVMKFQKELSQIRDPNAQNGVTVNVAVQNNTFPTTSDMYQIALENMQNDLLPDMPWNDGAMDEEMLILGPPEDDRLEKIESVIKKVVPDDAEDDAD